jgi:hypothetical protein
MFIAYIVVAVLLAAVASLSGRAKLTKDERVVKSITGVGVPLNRFPLLAAAEFAGAVGLLVGIAIAPIGIAAAIGLILYFLGAVLAHLRVRDFKGIPGPLPLLALAVAALILRILSA